MKVNLNTLAKEICKIEGKKVNLSIAQVKEVVHCFNEVLWAKPEYLVFFSAHYNAFAKKKAQKVIKKK